MSIKIKKGDNVIVIAGKDKGIKGEVLKVLPKKMKLFVAGVNIVKKHQKPTGNVAGGIIQKELPLHVSKVAIIDPKESKPTKIGYRVENGVKVRYAKLSGLTLEDNYKK